MAESWKEKIAADDRIKNIFWICIGIRILRQAHLCLGFLDGGLEGEVVRLLPRPLPQRRQRSHHIPPSPLLGRRQQLGGGTAVEALLLGGAVDLQTVQSGEAAHEEHHHTDHHNHNQSITVKLFPKSC